MIKLKKKNIYLSASIIHANWMTLNRDINQLNELNIDYLHFDIIDGKFASDFTIGSSIINKISKHTNINFDYHLMVNEPSNLFETFNFKKSNIVNIHQESSRNLHRDIINLKKKGLKVGCALSLSSPLESLEYLLDDIDVILIMTNNPDSSSQDFNPQILKKIYDMKNILIKRKLKTKISVDGHVNLKTIPSIIENGGDILILGTNSIFNDKSSIKKEFLKIKKLISNL
jgi:ribulose-phosphate 3-epimerase